MAIDVEVFVSLHERIERSEWFRVGKINDWSPVDSRWISEEKCIRVLVTLEHVCDVRIFDRHRHEATLYNIVERDGIDIRG